MMFNKIELLENGKIAKIKIDDIEIKGLQKYEIRRDADILELTITMSTLPENFKIIK